MYINKIKKEFISATKKAGFEITDDFNISRPEFSKYGDYSINIMFLAKKYKKSPDEIAKLTLKYIYLNKLYKVLFYKPAYINFYLKEEIILDDLLKKSNKDYQVSKNIKKEKIIIDYSSPNIAKPMSVGHLRSTIIGQALYNIFKYLGYQIIGDNHIGDWGTQFGKLIYAYKKWGISKKKFTINYLYELYVKFHFASEKDEKLNEYARAEFKKLEENDKENLKIRRKIRDISVLEFNKIYKILDVKFDLSLGESFYNKFSEKIIHKAICDNIAKTDQGAIIIPLDDFDKNLPPMLVKKQDGTTLYSSRDLAAIDYRVNKLKASKIIYVIGNEQSLYLKQLFLSASKLGYKKIKLEHVGFGLLKLNNKKMSSRKGNIILLEEMINMAIKRAKKAQAAKKTKLSSKIADIIAEKIGVAAIKYNDLSQNRNTDITFNYDKMLSLDGNSALYLQYTYTRAINILEKLKHKKLEFNKNIKINSTEREILRQLCYFEEILPEVVKNYEPHILTDYLFNLANKFNLFYQTISVIKTKKEYLSYRLAIVSAVSNILKIGLNLLGIETFNKI